MTGTLVHAHQRRALRRAMRVDCQVVRERDFRLLGTFAVDLSPLGMLVIAHEPALTGEPVIVAFRLPKSEHWFDTQATISRVLHGRRPGDGRRSFGLEFEPLDTAVAWHLRATLRGVPPPLPNREPRVDYAASVHLALLS